MSDFFDPIRLEDAEFAALLTKIERAFSQDQAALVIDERVGAREARIIGFEADFTQAELDAVIWMDALLYFAMGDSSDEAIREWAEQWEPELASRAVERARLARSSLPTLAAV